MTGQPEDGTEKPSAKLPDRPVVSRTRRALYHWFSGLGYSLLTLAVGMVTTPLLLRFLGPVRFGANRASGEWFGYLMLGDLGVGAALSVLLLRAHTSADPGRVAATARYGIRIMALQAAVLAPLAAALAWALPLLISVPPAFRTELQASGYVSILGFVIYPLAILRSTLEVQQRGYLVHAALAAQSLVITALSVLFASAGFGLPGQAAAALAGGIVFTAATLWFSRSLLGQIIHAPTAHLSWTQIGRFSWPLAVAGFGNRLSLMTDGIVVAKMLGAPEVARLFLTQRLVSLVGAQVNGMANATWAGLAELRTVDPVVFEDRVNELVRLVVGAGTIFPGIVAAYNERFVALWVGPSQYAGASVTLLAVANSAVFGLIVIFGAMIDMQGDTRHRLLSSFWGGIANLGLSVALVRWLGLPGVLLGTLIAYLLSDAWYCPLVACRRYGISPWRLGRSASRALLAGLPWIALFWMVAHRKTAGRGLLPFACEVFIVGVASVAYAVGVLFSKPERLKWGARVSSLLFRRQQR